VFKRGTCAGLKGTTPLGGHIIPMSQLGDRLLWKNAQKNEKKKRTSDKIKRIIPHRNPETTM
jgi:hypothetical protein